MQITVRSGNESKCAEIPEGVSVYVLEGTTPSDAADNAVREALRHPIGTERLRDIVKPGERIVILTSDISRPMPTAAVLPDVLDELYAAGVCDEDITVVIATGNHRAQTAEERERLVGPEIYRRVRCVDNDPTDCIHLGETSHGTPVDITRVVAEADRRICLGNIDFHYFAGYSGGIKALMPGCSTPAAIQRNHSMMLDDRASVGRAEDNPLRLDLEEAAVFCPIDFMVNVILGHRKEIIAAVAGDVVAAHRRGCELYDELNKVRIAAPADIVIASQGGAPKDLNLYQMQKALDNAQYAVRDGGTIILVGAANEGFGNNTFEEWMLAADRPQDLIDRIGREFRLGGHKAAAIAMVRQKCGIKLVSGMTPDLVRQAFLESYQDLQSAVDDALRQYENAGHDAPPTVIVIPYAGSTLPVVIQA